MAALALPDSHAQQSRPTVMLPNLLDRYDHYAMVTSALQLALMRHLRKTSLHRSWPDEAP
jgi:hypothetical protein